jgi:adenylate cyclase
VERRLAAILFTDIVDYTALMGRDETLGRRLRTRHEALVRKHVAHCQGQWIEEKGDESLSVFPSALQAVNCALAIQADLVDDVELRVRIGIHLGDVTLEGGRVYGDGVNVAARIYPLAAPGEIAISGPVYDSIKNQSAFEARSKGEHSLKNVAAPVSVWVVSGSPVTGPVDSRGTFEVGRGGPSIAMLVAVALLVLGVIAFWYRAGPVEPTPIRSLAVLPLDDLSSGETGGYLSFGMTEALIAELAKVGDLRIISRTSVTPYENTNLSMREIAAELGVDGIIEGSVQRAGDRVRVTAQLIDARSDSHLWAESYDRDMSDVLALQAELAHAIALEVKAEVAPAQPLGVGGTRPISPDAYEAYLKGYYFQMKRTRADTLRALRYFEKVIELEPEHPLGYSGMADEYSCAPTHSWSIAESDLWPSVPREMISRARDNAQKALELDSVSAAAHNSIALVRMFGDWDWPGAEAEFLKALKFGPGRAWGHSTYGLMLALQHRFDEALVEFEHAQALDPLRVEATMDLGSLHAWIGNNDEAFRYWQAAEEIDPSYVGLHQSVIIGFCGTKRHQEALSVLMGGNEKYPGDPLIMSELAYCHAASGNSSRARELLGQLDTLSEDMYVSPTSRAMIELGLGNRERALEELERAVREHDHLFLYLSVDRVWDPLRSDPRFEMLLDQVGLPRA